MRRAKVVVAVALMAAVNAFAASQGGTNVSTTAVQLIPARGNGGVREVLTISNCSTDAKLYVSTLPVATTNSGCMVPAGGTFAISASECPQGPISVVADKDCKVVWMEF